MKNKLLLIIIVFIGLLTGVYIGYIKYSNNNWNNSIINEIYNPNVYLDYKGIPKYIDGKDIYTTVNQKNDIYNVLNEVSDMYGFENSKDEFSLKDTNSIDDITYYKMQQEYKSYPVYGYELMLSVKNGNVQSINGNYYNGINLNTQYALTKNEIMDIAQKYTIGEYNIKDVYKSIYIKNDEPLLSYILRIIDENNYYDLVLSSNGNFIDRVPLYNMVALEVTNDGINNQECTINIDQSGNGAFATYKMHDPVRNISIIDGSSIGVDFGNANNKKWGNAIYFLLSTNTAKPMQVGYEDGIITNLNEYSGNNIIKTAITNMFNFSKVYDYYYENLGRKSFDGKGKEIRVFINVKNNALSLDKKNEHNNASYRGGDLGIFTIGSVDLVSYGYALDVLAHEFTHGVIEYTADLSYQNETGALNESYADVMGSLIEGKNFLIAEDVEEIRDMANPNKHEDPAIKDGKYYFPVDTDTYNEEYQAYILKKYEDKGSPLNDWKEADNGGVHTNSGVPNYAAYLAYNGNAYKDKKEMAKVYYNSLFLIGKNASFEDSALAIIQSAKNLNISEDKIKIIENAFITTNILHRNDSNVNGVVFENGTSKGIVDARITIVNKLNNGIYYETNTDINGKYNIAGIPSGEYKVIYEKSKYETYETDVKLVENDNIIDASLNKKNDEKSKKSEIVFVMDISNSMEDSDPSDIRKKIISNIVLNLDDDTKVGLITFNKVGNIVASMSNKSLNKKILVTDIFNIANDNGRTVNSGTNGKAGLAMALNLFSTANINKYIVFLTDGEDNVFDSSMSYTQIIESAQEMGIKMITIGLGSGDEIDEVTLKQLAKETNGKYYHANSALKLSRFNRRLFDELN